MKRKKYAYLKMEAFHNIQFILTLRLIFLRLVEKNFNFRIKSKE
jgi:hypothetical protein